MIAAAEPGAFSGRARSEVHGAPPGVAGNLPPLQADESRTRSGAQRSGMQSSPNADISMPPYLGTVGG